MSKRLDKICEWSARLADIKAKDYDEWETIYYNELERLDDQTDAIRFYFQEGDRG